MMYFDSYGFPVEARGDGGDSAVRAGLLAMCDHKMSRNIKYGDYETKDENHLYGGLFVRHPIQIPWNNPKNYSRDQMLPFIAGLHRRGQHMPVEEFFYARMFKFFFSQNTERDAVGSAKKPWSHWFFKDSKPISRTWNFWENNIPNLKAPDLEHKWFDSADPLLPNHIGCLIIAGRMTGWYWFLALAYPVHLFFLLLHPLMPGFEENQKIAECYLFGTLGLYKKIHSRGPDINAKYWRDRGEIEYFHMLQEFLK